MTLRRSVAVRSATPIATALLAVTLLALVPAAGLSPAQANDASDAVLSDDAIPGDDSAAYIRDLNGGRLDVHGDLVRGDDIGRPVRPSGDDNVVVPEPGTLALLGLGLAAVGVARRRRRA